MTAHKHAHLMLQYAQDAAETDKPWDRWQFRSLNTEGWLDCASGTGFSDLCEYRRKPRTMTYTVTIPEPLLEAPEAGAAYYVVDCAAENLYTELEWYGYIFDTRLLKRGLCFATKEDAIAAAMAMLPVKGK